MHGEIESPHPGFLIAQDTCYIGYIKGIGRLYQQTGIDTHANIGFDKVYTGQDIPNRETDCKQKYRSGQLNNIYRFSLCHFSMPLVPAATPSTTSMAPQSSEGISNGWIPSPITLP